MLYELATLKPPFQGTGMKDLFNKISKGEFERIPKCYSNELYDIIRRCLRLNPNERPSCDEILSNPFIQEKFPEELVREKVFSKAQLLNTIKMPRNLQGLKGKLPKANYHLNNKSFEEEEEERNVLRRCPSESGLREKKDIKDKIDPSKMMKKNSFEEKEKILLDERIQIKRTPKYEEKTPIIKNQPSEMKKQEYANRALMEKPPIQKNVNYGMEKYEKNERYEKVGIIKSNKVEQPLKKVVSQQVDPRNYIKPPIEPPRNMVKIERPVSRQEIKKYVAVEDKKPLVNNNANINRPAIKNIRPSSQQDPRRMKEQEKIMERKPQIKNNWPIKKGEIHQKIIPKTPSNKENVIVGRRCPGLEIKNKKK